MVGRDHVVQHGKTEALLRLKYPMIANFAATDCREIKVLQIDIRSDNKIVLSDRKALLGSRVAFIFDKGWGRV